MSKVEVVGGHASVDHTVLENLIWRVRILDGLKEPTDDLELLPLVLVDHAFNERRLGEVVSQHLVRLHLFLALPGFPELLASHVTIYDGIVADSAQTQSTLQHEVGDC